VPVVGPRFLIEAGFIIAVAVIAGIARLDTLAIVGVMTAAWLIVAAVEITVSRKRVRAQAAANAGEEPQPPPAPVVVRARQPEPEPEPELEPRAKSEPVRAPPRIVAALSPEPEPEPEPGEEPTTVIAFPAASASPREWNLWELERVARDHASGDVARDEERAYLLMYLREFAGPDGVLPADFDGLVRDAFGDVLHTVGA
jgi:hypothetical protein